MINQKLKTTYNLYRFGYGRAFGDSWFGEVYLIGKKSDETGFQLEAYELEAKWQITEQGEYWADWGLLMELEKESHENIWEFSTGILVEERVGGNGVVQPISWSPRNGALILKMK